MKLVGVQFRAKNTEDYGGKTYVYKTDLDLKLNDYVVVETCYGPVVAVVSDVDVESIKYSLAKQTAKVKYVICKFDFEHVKELKEQEKRIVETRHRIKELYKQKMLEQMAKDLLDEFPELADEINTAKAANELESLFMED